MPTGAIKTLSDRGFGFITPDDAIEDVFFHSSALVDVTFEQLRRGDRVTFQTEPDQRGRGVRAVDVQRLPR